MQRILLGWVEVAIWSCVAIGILWSCGAVFYLPGVSLGVAGMLVLVAIAAVVGIGYCENLWQVRGVLAGIPVAVYCASLVIRPSNDRVWDPDQDRLARVLITDGQVEIQNFRNNIYRSEIDYDARFETRRFQLDQLESIWLVVQRFSNSDGLAHVFLSFGLRSEPGANPDAVEFFSLSVEVRRELGELYDPVRGLYRCYEVTHVIGDERDLIGVRTVHRPDDRVYLYRLTATPAQVQQLFVRFSQRIEKLNQQPEFYHSLLNNCANGITRQTCQLTEQPVYWLDYRVVFPGYRGRLAFDMGLLVDTGELSFEKIEAQSRIDLRAREAGITDDFSLEIRR